MTYEAVHNAIRGRFATEIAAKHNLTTIYDNDQTAAPTDGSKWCRFTIRDGANNRITLGSGEYRGGGLAIAQLFDVSGKGDKDLLELADAIVTAFRGVSLAGVRFERNGQTPEVEVVGESEGLYQINVIVHFETGNYIAA